MPKIVVDPNALRLAARSDWSQGGIYLINGCMAIAVAWAGTEGRGVAGLFTLHGPKEHRFQMNSHEDAWGTTSLSVRRKDFEIESTRAIEMGAPGANDAGALMITDVGALVVGTNKFDGRPLLVDVVSGIVRNRSEAEYRPHLARSWSLRLETSEGVFSTFDSAAE